MDPMPCARCPSSRARPSVPCCGMARVGMASYAVAMKGRFVALVSIGTAFAATAVAVSRHGGIGHGRAGHHVAGGTIMGDASFYDRTGRLLLSGFTRSIAEDVSRD